MDIPSQYTSFSAIKSQLDQGQLQAAAATEKELTTESWAQIFAVAAVLGVAVLGEEPMVDNPRVAAEWKASNLKSQLAKPEVDADPEKTIGFASDVLFVDTKGNIRHKESRKGLLSKNIRQQLYIQLLSLDINNPADRATERDILLMLNQDLDAKSQVDSEGKTVIEDFQDQYSQDFTVFWQGAYVMQLPDGQQKVTQLTVQGDFGPINAKYVVDNFEPKINAGIPLVEAAPIFGGQFYLVDGNGTQTPIDLSLAYSLIVKKTLPVELLQEFVENPGTQVEPLLDSEDFLDYWFVEINAQKLFDPSVIN